MFAFTEEFNDEKIHLDASGIQKFIAIYLANRNEKLITFPDFDKIKCTKLFPVVHKRNQTLDYINTHMIEDGGVFGYIGEIERFWPHFNKKWFPGVAGVLMHSFCSKKLKAVLHCSNKINFEFDWLFWHQSRVVLFEVGMRETKNNHQQLTDDKISDIIRDKLNMTRKQYLPVLKVLFYSIGGFRNKNEMFESWLFGCLSVVLFLANVDHKRLRNKVEEYIKSRMQSGDFTDQEKTSLSFIHFAGDTLDDSMNKGIFYKYDVDRMRVIEVRSTDLVAQREERNGEIEASKFEEIMGTFALSYFCTDGSNIIGNFKQGPGSLLERFIDAQKKFIEKVHGIQHLKKDLLKLDVLLSPQQFRILLEDRKFLRCVGEAGSGKTELLLSKALISSLRDDVERIIFWVPRQVSPDAPLIKIVENYKERKNIDKMDIVGGGLIYKVLLELDVSRLKKTVLLVDEFQDRYENCIEISQEKFLYLSQQVFPYLKTCWMVSTTLKYIDRESSIEAALPYFFDTAFYLSSMNVTFRSATHIAEFCSSLADESGTSLRFSNARTKGVFMSKQTSVEIITFPKNFSMKQSLNAEGTATKANCFLGSYISSDFSYKREQWFVIFCNRERKDKWSCEIEFFSPNENRKVFLIVLEDGPSSCAFSGGEACSVVVYIDGPEIPSQRRKKLKYSADVALICF